MRFRENEINDPLLLSERKVGEREFRKLGGILFRLSSYIDSFALSIANFLFFPPASLQSSHPAKSMKECMQSDKRIVRLIPLKTRATRFTKKYSLKKKVRRFVEPSSKSSSNRVKNTLPLPVRKYT